MNLGEVACQLSPVLFLFLFLVRAHTCLQKPSLLSKAALPKVSSVQQPQS